MHVFYRSLIAIAIVTSGCSRSEQPKQTYAEALAIYTAEQTELERLERQAAEQTKDKKEFVQLRAQTLSLELNVANELKKPSERVSQEELLKVADDRIANDPELQKRLKELAHAEADMKKKLDYQRTRVHDAEKAKNRLVP
jgi:hypothetical protein